MSAVGFGWAAGSPFGENRPTRRWRGRRAVTTRPFAAQPTGRPKRLGGSRSEMILPVGTGHELPGEFFECVGIQPPDADFGSGAAERDDDPGHGAIVVLREVG